MKRESFLIKILHIILLCFIALLVSCSGLFTTKKSSEQKNEDKQAYISVQLQTDKSRMAQGTLFPESQKTDLTDFVLTGKLGDTGAEQTLKEATTLTDLTSAPIALDPGSWNFTLTAKLDGISFISELSKVQVNAGVNETVEFALEPVSTVTKGGLDVTVKFPDTATSVQVSLQKFDGGTPEENTYTADGSTYKILTDAEGKKSINIVKTLGDNGTTGLEPGTYHLNFAFFSDDVSEALNNIDVYAAVPKGFTVSKTIEISDLNAVYNITYKAYKTESDKPTGVTSQDNVQSLLAAGQTLVNKYTRKTSVTLPVLSLTGYSFAGWYDEGDNKVENWTQKTGDITLYAKWSSAGVGVEVTNPTEKVTLTKTDPDADGKITFTATTTTGATTYAWYVDGVKDDTATGSTFEFDKTGKAFGNYVITVECGGYSAAETVTKGLLGSKTAPNALYDIVFKDGSAEAYQEGMTLTDEQKASAVAIIFNMQTTNYYGEPYNGSTNNRTLGLGIKNSNGDTTKTTYKWMTSNAKLYSKKFTDELDFNDWYYSPDNEDDYPVYEYGTSSYISGDLNGNNNWGIFIDAAYEETNEGLKTNYPAFNYANNYALNNGLSSTNYADNWYIPTVPELICVNSYKATLNTILTLLDGDIIADERYWSSSRWYTDNSDYETSSQYSLNMANNSWREQGDSDGDEYRVLVIREF